MEQAAGVESSELVLPTGPDGFCRTDSGLFVPEKELTPKLELKPMPELNQPTLLLGAEAINACPDDILKGTETPASTYEPAYLWYDAPAALNSVIDSASLDSLKEKFGKLQQFSERDKLLSVLNGRSSEEELDTITSDFYSLLGEVHARASSKVLEDCRLWDYLGVMADYLMIESDMQDLTMDDDTLQLILRGLDNHNIPEKLLDFIAHFDIPRELAGKLLDRIDEYPNHPLYWWVASRYPDHPVVAQQRRAVEALAAGDDESAFAHLNPENLLPLGSLLPDRTFPRTGLELETTTFVDTVKVPEGTVMGYDGAKGVDGILELRLNHEGDRSVLNYGPEWLHRYFKVWRWEKIARGVSSSIHLHSDGISTLKLERARILFGLDDNSCRYNNLGTVEVRSALGGYIDKKLDGEGYSELPPPALIELLHLVEDVCSPLFLAAKSRLGWTAWRSRVGNHNKYSQQVGKQLLESLQKNDQELSQDLFYRVAEFDHDMQQAVVEAAVDNGEHRLVIHFLSLLSPDLQKAVVREFCRTPSDWANIELISQVSQLDSEIQATVMKYALEREDKIIISYVLQLINVCTDEQQLALVERVIAADDRFIFKDLVESIHKIRSPYLRDRVAQEAIKRNYDDKSDDPLVIRHNYGKYLRALLQQFDLLSSDLQNDIINRELSRGYNAIDHLMDYMGALNLEQQKRVIENIPINHRTGMPMISPEDYAYQIKSEELRLKYLARLYNRWSSPFQQTIIRHNTGRRNEAKLRETSWTNCS